MSKQKIKSGTVIKIPAEVAVCPICRSALYTNFDCWLFVKGEWLIESCNMDCENQPDIDSPDWNEWFAGHYSTPYVDWLGVEKKVVGYINENYCFEIEDT